MSNTYSNVLLVDDCSLEGFLFCIWTTTTTKWHMHTSMDSNKQNLLLSPIFITQKQTWVTGKHFICVPFLGNVINGFATDVQRKVLPLLCQSFPSLFWDWFPMLVLKNRWPTFYAKRWPFDMSKFQLLLFVHFFRETVATFVWEAAVEITAKENYRQ